MSSQYSRGTNSFNFHRLFSSRYPKCRSRYFDPRSSVAISLPFESRLAQFLTAYTRWLSVPHHLISETVGRAEHSVINAHFIFERYKQFPFELERHFSLLLGE